MKYKFEITIAAVQGLGSGPFEYKICLDSMVQQLFDTDTFEIYGEGNFSLIVYKSQQEVGGVTFPMKLLKGLAKQWFPLALPFEELQNLSQNIEEGKARVMLIITQNTVLSPVLEHREISESSPVSVISYSQPVQPPEDGSLKEVLLETISAEIEMKEACIKKIQRMIEQTKSEQKRVEQATASLKEQLKKIKQTGEDMQESLLQQLKALEGKIQDLQQQNLSLKTQIEEIHIENWIQPNPPQYQETLKKLRQSDKKRKEIQQALKSLSFQYSRPPNTLSTYLQKQNQNLAYQLHQRTQVLKQTSQKLLQMASGPRPQDQNLSVQVQTLLSKVAASKLEKKDLKASLQAYKQENSSYKQAIDQLRASLTKQEEQNSELSVLLKSALAKLPSRQRDVDKALRQYIQHHGIKNPFSKISDGVYHYGTRRVTIALRNGIPVIRVGGGYMFIQEFIKVYQNKKKEDQQTPRRRSMRDEELEESPSRPLTMRESNVCRPTKSSVMKTVVRNTSKEKVKRKPFKQ